MPAAGLCADDLAHAVVKGQAEDLDVEVNGIAGKPLRAGYLFCDNLRHLRAQPARGPVSSFSPQVWVPLPSVAERRSPIRRVVCLIPYPASRIPHPVSRIPHRASIRIF